MQLFICLNVQRNEKDHALIIIKKHVRIPYKSSMKYKKKLKGHTLIFDIKMYVHVL